MSGDATDREAIVQDLIGGLSSSLERDGYTLQWSVADADSRLHARIVAGPGACEECLVPKPLLESMLDAALEGSGVTVGSLTMPGERA